MIDIPTIQRLVERSGEKIAAIEREAGIGKDGLRNLLRGVKNDTSTESAYHLAKYFGVRIEDLLGRPVLGKDAYADQLPIRYETGAGMWADVERLHIREPDWVQAIPIRGIPKNDQWMERIVGDSIDRLIPKGALVHVVCTSVMAFEHGDVVIIEQIRDGGHLVMRTAKQVAFTSKGPEFWPRSYNPQWEGPLQFTHNDDDDGAAVRISGVVKRAIIDF